MSNITISDIMITPETQSFLRQLEEQEIGGILGGDGKVDVSLFWGAITFRIEWGDGDEC